MEGIDMDVCPATPHLPLPHLQQNTSLNSLQFQQTKVSKLPDYVLVLSSFALSNITLKGNNPLFFYTPFPTLKYLYPK